MYVYRMARMAQLIRPRHPQPSVNYQGSPKYTHMGCVDHQAEVSYVFPPLLLRASMMVCSLGLDV
jgi:hypothetical protein